MPKKTSDDESSPAQPTAGENTPPLLSEKLIAQLQGAVEAARRKRAQPNAGGNGSDVPAGTSGARRFRDAADESQLAPGLVGHEGHRVR